MYRYGHFVHGPGVFGWLVFALFLALMVVAIVALLRSWRGLGALRPFAAGPQRPSHGVDPALNELRVRYARGDIDWNEYAHRAINLGFPVAPPGPHATSPGNPGTWVPPGGAPPADTTDS